MRTASPLTETKEKVPSGAGEAPTKSAGGEAVARYSVECCDCLVGMARIPTASVDAIVSDPPYGLSFMGKSWDHGVPGVPFWSAALRVAKPGAHLLAAGGTRTYHRLACAIEDAGWEIRDCISWVYASGFPKSLNVGKALDALAGAERQRLRAQSRKEPNVAIKQSGFGADGWAPLDNNPISDEAKAWDGWGTALKPSVEPFILARKPLGMTVARCVLEHGTGAINVGACRVEYADAADAADAAAMQEFRSKHPGGKHTFGMDANPNPQINDSGRWPANLIHDGSPDALSALGSAARCFYCAKASRSEREAGLREVEAITRNRVNAGGLENDPKWAPVQRKNNHPTVKPIALMRYLCRLVTPPGGLVLDPFMGSGTTGCAALIEGFRFHGFDMEPRYVEIADARIRYWGGLTLAPDERSDEAQGTLFAAAGGDR